MKKQIRQPPQIDIECEKRVGEFVDKYGIEKLSELNFMMETHLRELYGADICSSKFNTMTINEKVVHGWLRGTMFMTEGMINGRWPYWLDIRVSHEVEGKPIPQLHFYYSYDSQYKQVADMIKDCLNYMGRKGIYGYKALECFIDWLLFAFGSPICNKLPIDITDDINDYWYRNFKPQYMYLYPSDYFVSVASEIYSGKAFNANAFYPTPAHVVQLMVEMVYNEADTERNKYASVVEPCMGSGIMLLYQSNKSLRLYGQDIDQLMCKIATVNGYLYVPWMVEGDPETDKLLADMHDKYFNEVELEIDEDFISFLNKPMNDKGYGELIKTL